jgi:hypothetical protein
MLSRARRGTTRVRTRGKRRHRALKAGWAFVYPWEQLGGVRLISSSELAGDQVRSEVYVFVNCSSIVRSLSEVRNAEVRR